MIITKDINIRIRVCTDTAEKENTFLNYDIPFYLGKDNKRIYDTEEFILYLIRHLETDTEREGKPINHLKEWGWDIVCTSD